MVTTRTVVSATILAALLPLAMMAWAWRAPSSPNAPLSNVVFSIGTPDGSAGEFGLSDSDYQSYLHAYPGPVVYTVGRSRPQDWPFIQPSTHDGWAGGRAHVFTIRFPAEAAQAGRPLYLYIGLVADWEPSRIRVAVNGAPIGEQRLPSGSERVKLAFDPLSVGLPATLVFPVPAGRVVAGDNTLTIGLDDGSWMVYDYVQLTASPTPPPFIKPTTPELLTPFLAGPMAKTTEIVFAVRQPGRDPHWYANFGYDANDPATRMYGDGGRLCRLNLRTHALRVLLDDPKGGVRDPQVDYDGKRILFSYRRGGTETYHLYEIGADGGRLRQLTDGPYDDIEPTYLPDGDIVFVSTRCNRWVNCWRTPVATLHRCDADGKNIRPLSSNIEQDNTPWPLPDGRLLYTRWEYVDRSQVHYHHLWTCNPDGTAQMVYFGNLDPGTVMIDSKPIPGSRRVVSIFSPGHGQTEHDGDVEIVDPSAGPDAVRNAHPVTHNPRYRDPWAFSEDCILAASGPSLVVMNGHGATQEIFRLSDADIRAGLQCNEPRPLCPRRREPVLANRVKLAETTGRMILEDVTHGRNMAGVKPTEIKKLLVLETLPKPVNFTGGMEPLSYGGTFTLERILGTVPVERDGSAYFTLPALRSVFFVALDANDVPIRRMQSFTCVEPGETVSCVGCHEQRVKAPYANGRNVLLAAQREPSRIEPIPEAPDVFDFPRDIQPILDRHCLTCHDWNSHSGGVVLSGDRGPIYSHSYFTLFARNQVSDGRNRPGSNYPPRALGSVASALMRKLDGTHHSVTVTEHERTMVRLWIETGAPYPGTYAALGTGMVGGYVVNALDRSDTQWPATRRMMQTLQQRCVSCHTGSMALPLSASDDQGRPPWEDMSPDDPRRRFANHLLYNLTRPDKSPLLLSPLSRQAGSWGLCQDHGAATAPVLTSTADPDYRAILAGIVAAQARLDTIKRFDMPGFRSHVGWVREMKRYGVLPAKFNPGDPVDVYDTDRRYWRSLWYTAPTDSTVPVQRSSVGGRPRPPQQTD